MISSLLCWPKSEIATVYESPVTISSTCGGYVNRCIDIKKFKAQTKHRSALFPLQPPTGRGCRGLTAVLEKKAAEKLHCLCKSLFDKYAWRKRNANIKTRQHRKHRRSRGEISLISNGAVFSQVCCELKSSSYVTDQNDIPPDLLET